MKRTLSLLALGLLFLSGCSLGKDDEAAVQEPTQVQESVTPSDSNQTGTISQTEGKSCKDSGGTVKNGACVCPSDTYGSGNTPIFTYNEKTGYCEDPDGAPGGILGTDGKGADL